MKKTYTTTDGKNTFTRSRWIKVRTAYKANKNNSLYDYVSDGNGHGVYSDKFDKKDVYLDYFKYNGRKYALNQFTRFGSVWCNMPPYEIIDKDGKTTFINGYDADNYYNPLFIEIDEYGENIRIYQEEKQ